MSERKRTQVKNLLRWARRRAEDKGVVFCLREEDIVIPAYCPVLGLKLTCGEDLDRSPSLDRIVPEWGYVPGNVLVVSARANRIKSDGLPWELRRIAEYYEQHIVNHY